MSHIIRNKCGHSRAGLASHCVTQCGSVKEPKWLQRYLEAQATRLVGSMSASLFSSWWGVEVFHCCVSDQHKLTGLKNTFLSTLSWARSPSTTSLGPVQGCHQVLSSVTWGQVKVVTGEGRSIALQIPMLSCTEATGFPPNADQGLSSAPRGV